MEQTSEPGQLTALTGGGIWIVWAAAVRPDWTVVLLMLSPFVLLPLGLKISARPSTGPEAPAIQTLARVSPALATTAAASFIPEPGLLAALLSIPWLAFTLVVALTGAARLLSRRTLIDPGLGVDAGLIFVAVGGAWLTISRAGLNPLGFGDAIVQLTAVHFHFAGFALPIAAGFTASRLHRSALVPLAVIVGVPLTAIGITVGGGLEWVAATLMATAGIGTAGLLLQLSSHISGKARWLLGAAGSALLAGMTLALGWSWSMRFGWGFLALDSMAAIHGSLNALGFGLLGLVGLSMLTNSADTESMRTNGGETNLHLRTVPAGTLERLAVHAASQPATNTVGLLDRETRPGFTRKSWERTAEHGDLSAAKEAIRRWRGHHAAGIKRAPQQPEIAIGETLAMAIPVGPLAISATCRIIDVVDEPDRYGFTYSTLPHHPEDGEESFIVCQHEDADGDVTVDVTVTAVWRGATIANHVCPPLTRFLQNHAVNRYLEGIAVFDGHTHRIAT